MAAPRSSSSVLVLGSGLCSPPLIGYLLKHGFRVTVATRTVCKAEKLLQGHPNGRGVAWDISTDGALDRLDQLVQQVDLVVSLLPYIHHVASAKVALKHKKHFCTASYISDEMLALDPIAKEAGVIMLNECGVDPGLDHMSAQKIIDEVHAKGGKVREFYSICGGLPAPESNNNPLGYKLAWSPRGVLLASRNDAYFLENGEAKKLPGIDLYAEGIYRPDSVDTVGHLEWYVNRDSVKYINIYNIPEVDTIIRGTYRYPGWCRMMRKIALNGFTSLDEIQIQGRPYAAFTAKILGLDSVEDLPASVAKKLDLAADDDIIHRFSWLGLFDKEKVVKEGIKTALDAVCELFEDKLQYAQGEKDMICMKHTFEVEYGGGVRERLTSTLINFGMQPEGDTSMARTVALPLAIAVKAVLEKRINLTGIVRPILPELYNHILDEMEHENITFVDRKLPPHFHIRCETTEKERRTPVTPEGVKALVEAGFQVSVERFPLRCFPDADYEANGAKLVDAGSWVNSPPSTVVLGLKELIEGVPLRHRHICFGHCYKGQQNAEHLLQRFAKSNGYLFDIEFLTEENGRRIAAFGYPAGFSGAAVGLLHWAEKQNGGKLDGPLSPWPNGALQDEVRSKLNGRKPVVHVMGALGRAGRGAADFAESVGCKVIRWDLEETKAGGPFPVILEADIFVNCIYVTESVPPFLTSDFLRSEKKLSVVVDVSCDYDNPKNPIPFYNQGTSVNEPVLPLPDLGIDLVAIDNLPSLVPRVSSERFARDFLPYLLAFQNEKDPKSSVWSRAGVLFEQKIAHLK